MDADRVALLECNLDDMTGEALGYAMERLLAEGALDVWFTPITMKKSRPAVMLSVLCRENDVDTIQAGVLRHTTTLGIRCRWVDRVKAQREVVPMDTPWGQVRCKVKRLGQQIVSIKAEYDDCVRAAARANVPLASVSGWAEREAWGSVGGKKGEANHVTSPE